MPLQERQTDKLFSKFQPHSHPNSKILEGHISNNIFISHPNSNILFSRQDLPKSLIQSPNPTISATRIDISYLLYFQISIYFCIIHITRKLCCGVKTFESELLESIWLRKLYEILIHICNPILHYFSFLTPPKFDSFTQFIS